MHILEEKKRTHIAGYVISMWHLEGLIRALEFKTDDVLAQLIPAEAPEAEKAEASKVYSALVERMQEQGLQKDGHLEEVNDAINEMQYLHDSIVGAKQDDEYLKLYELAREPIQDLKGRAEHKNIGEVLACFNGVYGLLVLRARNEQVSPDTLDAEKQIRALLDALSDRYKAIRSFPDPSLN